jgi:hypothetical protein
MNHFLLPVSFQIKFIFIVNAVIVVKNTIKLMVFYIR